jgi:glycine oxidase
MPDVVILGGGIIGCSIAYQLAKRGRQVCVLDTGQIGAQASSAAVGALAPMKLFARRDNPLLALHLKSLALFPSFLQEIEQITEHSCEYQQSGAVRFARATERERIAAWVDEWREEIPMHVKGREEIREQEPAIDASSSLAVFIPTEAQVCASAYMRAVAMAARRTGATLSGERRIEGIISCGARVRAVRTDTGTIPCDALLLAAGAWSGQVGKLLGLRLPVRPMAGQAIEMAQPPFPIRHLLFGEGVYIAPKSYTTLYIGATQEDMGFTPHVQATGVVRLVEKASRLVPALASLSVKRAWVGLRPTTPDHLPILGKAPGWENVTVATGHGGFGVLLSVITGITIADFVSTGSLPAILRPFLPERFATGTPS